MPNIHVETSSSTNHSLWQFRTQENLSEEDLRQIKENLVGFFSVLNEWDENAKQ